MMHYVVIFLLVFGSSIVTYNTAKPNIFYIDSINTPKAMKDIADLITETNLYMKNNSSNNLNAVLLKEIALYCTNLFRVC